MVVIKKILQVWLIKVNNIARTALIFYKAFNYVLKKKKEEIKQ